MRSVQSRLAGRFERALVVDDNDALRRSLVRLIANWGAQVVSAATLRAAAALIDPAPDLVVADIRLPDGNGRTLFEHALRMEPTPLLVAISGRATAGEGFELARLGVHTLLEKPFELSTFEQAVQSALLYSENTCDQRARLAVASRLELELRSLARRRELSVQQVQVLRLLARVDFFVDGRLVGSDTSAPYGFQYQTPSGLATDQRLVLSASATDSAGHVTQSEAVNVTVGRDDQKPVVNIVSPAITKTSAGDEIAPVVERSQVVVRMTGYDNVGVDKLELRGVTVQNGTYVLTGDLQNPLSALELVPEAIPGGLHAFSAFKLVNIPAFSGATGVTEDRYPIRVTATDGAGNVSTAEITIGVRADAVPTIGVKQVDRPSFRPRDLVGLSVQALDDLAVKAIEVHYFVDGASSSAADETRTIDPQAPNVQERFSLDLRTLHLSNAAHTIRAELVAVDSKNKRSDQVTGGAASLDITVVPDHSPPLVSISAPIPGVDLYRGDDVAFSWRAVDDSRLSSFEVRNGSTLVYSTTLSETHHEGSFHYVLPSSGTTLTLSIRANDELDNEATTTATYPLVADAAPTVTIRSPAPGTRLTEGEALTISALPADDRQVVSATFFVDVDGTTIDSRTITGSELASAIASGSYLSAGLRVPHKPDPGHSVSIGVRVKDNANQPGEALVDLSILDDLEPPRVTISAPAGPSSLENRFVKSRHATPSARVMQLGA